MVFGMLLWSSNVFHNLCHLTYWVQLNIQLLPCHCQWGGVACLKTLNNLKLYTSKFSCRVHTTYYAGQDHFQADNWDARQPGLGLRPEFESFRSSSESDKQRSSCHAHAVAIQVRRAAARARTETRVRILPKFLQVGQAAEQRARDHPIDSLAMHTLPSPILTSGLAQATKSEKPLSSPTLYRLRKWTTRGSRALSAALIFTVQVPKSWATMAAGSKLRGQKEEAALDLNYQWAPRRHGEFDRVATVSSCP